MSQPPAWARRLGYLGLIPFVTGAAAVCTGHAPAAHGLAAYAATIASFLGAIHWGLTMREAQPNNAALAWGVMPSLIAWVALLLPTAAGLYLLAGLLLVCWGVDRRVYARSGLGTWMSLRTPLTVVATLSCLMAAVCSSL